MNLNLDTTLNIVWNELKYKATVHKAYAADLPRIKCYPQQLNQVFMNILVNAAQAIEKQGEIRIVTRESGGFVEIIISDTGQGIPEANLSRIFDPFFTSKEVGKGTGLGLNVAYNIIKKHQGNIDVQSEVGKGTTFSVRITVNGPEPSLSKDVT
jgi:two-component system, NtrC family, sensor kinase